MRKLSELKIGESGVIHSFENDDIFLKLMEMGCIPGELIIVEQIVFITFGIDIENTSRPN